ncbi:coiled-coil domain-containing protein 107 [Engystomops pustulosus]|uniref:coiled-coil domain-containing protein 107 n=1 Tax=Engystomops pustulosus TaxID=76066 RepID=UPI003AFB3E12
MVLSSSQHLLIALSLAVCACFLLPRMFGGAERNPGRQDPRSMRPPMQGRSAPRENQGKRPPPRKEFPNNNAVDQIKSEMEKQLNTEKTGTNHSMAFTLMPLYAVGVAVFAAYKFSKMKSNEKNKLKSSRDDEKKTKATENQLLELEKHLFQTEKMLNSLLTQLDPLSNCVNSLAMEQKDEIMTQLLSIRQLMKKSGMDRSNFSKSEKQTCEDTLEDLIHSLKTEKPETDEEVESDVSKPVGAELHLPVAENLSTHCEDEQDVTPEHTSDGLRKRNVKD